MISASINGIEIQVKRGTSILQAAEMHNIYIPTLCNHPDLPPAGECGICTVKANGKFVSSCCTKLKEGMVIDTQSPDVKAKAFESLQNFKDVSMWPKTHEIETIYEYFDPSSSSHFRTGQNSNYIHFNPNRCVNCTRCIRECSDGQYLDAISDSPSKSSENCISCGQCTTVCPTGALSERNDISKIIRALSKGKILVLQIAPSVRVSLGECFGDPIGTVVTGKIISSAREIGFQYIFDTNFGADLTIVEEGTELISRLTKQSSNNTLPMFTSCCPGWVNFVEKFHPELIPNLSTAKSPHAMTGSMIKNYFSVKKGINPGDLFVVSLMPCIAKKDEINRPQIQSDVDVVITAREYSQMIKQFDINWADLEDGQFDSLLGESTGPAALFGVSGGVMEAAIRFAHEQMTQSKFPYETVEYKQWRGFDDIKTASIKIADFELNIAVCNGIANAKEIIENGSYKAYHFIEVMACPCGCIAGGGQPKLKSRKLALQRANSLYALDEESEGKTANDNQEIAQLYEFLGEYGSPLAHQLLHTHFVPRK